MRSRHGRWVLVLALGVLPGVAPALGGQITLTLIPASGDVAGLPGSTVGWGYTITNTTSDWIQTMNLSAGLFQDGTPNEIFDFPAVGPGDSVTLGFSLAATASCSFPPCGIYELTWNSTAPSGFTNSGTFTVSSDYYSAEPGTSGATDLGPAPDASAPYSAVVSPEPGTWTLLGSALAWVGGLRFRRQVHGRRFATRRVP